MIFHGFLGIMRISVRRQANKKLFNETFFYLQKQYRSKKLTSGFFLKFFSNFLTAL